MGKNGHIKKEAFLKALEKSLGIVTKACKEVDIHRNTYYLWLKEDEDFKRSVEDIENVALDFAESALHEQIKEGIPSSTMFYLKTKGKKRGYIEKTETQHSGRIESVNVSFESTSAKPIESENDMTDYEE